MAIRIQVQAIATVHILLCKSSDYRIVEPRPQIILLRDEVQLLTIVLEAVGNRLNLLRQVAKAIVGVAVENIAVFVCDMGR